jgi:hypothetical protein
MGAAYEAYGGRGIEFKFASGMMLAVYVLQTLGARPSRAHSLDRVDNDGHYERGNIRWATREEQAGNKRRYVCWRYGDRIAQLADTRIDLSYETIRTWINKGMTDEEIINRPKGAGGRPSIRHRKLRATKSLRSEREGGI